MTKDKVMFGMMDLALDVGLEKASIGTLSKYINISPGNIYYHFENKEDLVTQTFKFAKKLMADYVLANLQNDDLAHFLRMAISRAFDFYCQNESVFMFIDMATHSSYLKVEDKKEVDTLFEVLYMTVDNLNERQYFQVPTPIAIGTILAILNRFGKFYYQGVVDNSLETKEMLWMTISQGISK